jgi:hypothetical protein
MSWGEGHKLGRLVCGGEKLHVPPQNYAYAKLNRVPRRCRVARRGVKRREEKRGEERTGEERIG